MDNSRDIVEWATKQATSLLPPLGNRWLHVQGVVERARWVGQLFNERDCSYLIAAAYVHDIGYAPSLKKTGFHPLDGADYLQSKGQDRLATLVAYHSAAQFEARLRGLASELAKFPHEYSAVADALAYCDLTTSSIGEQVSFEKRIADIRSRYDDTDIVVQALRQAMPTWSIAIEHIERALREHGLVKERDR